MPIETNYKIIFRIEIDTLFDARGKLSLEKMEHLVMLCTSIQNAGFQVLMVSSGAIMLGTEKMGLPEPPTELITKQAIAAIGQADLMKYYQLFFDSFDQVVAQVLLTRDVVDNPIRNRNAKLTLKTLLKRGIIPIINENDSVSTDDIILNDNYPLTLIVAQLIKPHAIVVKSYQENEFKLIVRNNPEVMTVNEEDIFKLADRIKSGRNIGTEKVFQCENGLSVSEINKENQAAIKMIDGFPGVISLT